jgi:hypothetical protein
MLSLAAFQAQFGARLSAARASAAGPDPLDRAIRVHLNTSLKAAHDALALNYPVVKALFGEQAFAACALAFVTAAPPRDARLTLYGGGFAAFLAGYPPARAAPYAPDVATLERHCTEALFAPDAPALDGHAAAAALAAGRVIALHPAARFAAFGSPAFSIWRAHQDGPPEDLETVVWRREAALVTRPDGDLIVAPLAVGGVEFLSAAAAGEPLEAAAMAAHEAGADVSALFADLITAGAFAATDPRRNP